MAHDKKGRLLLLALLAVLWPACGRAEDGTGTASMSAKVSAGGLAYFTGDTSSTITPFARIEAVAPIPLFSGTGKDKDGNAFDRSWRWPQLEVTADLTGLPGQAAGVDVANFDTYKAIEMEIGLLETVFQGGSQRVSFGVAGGFATRLPGSTKPRDRTARWGQLLAEVANTGGAAYLRVGIGGDQRLDSDYRLVTIIEGAVRLRPGDDKGLAKDVEIRLVGDAILGLSVAGFLPSTHDCVRLGIALTR